MQMNKNERGVFGTVRTIIMAQKKKCVCGGGVVAIVSGAAP